MYSDLSEWRADYCGRYQYGAAAATFLSLFAKRLAFWEDSDFYFKLDEVRTSCQRDTYLDLVYLLIQLDERYIGHRVVVSAMTILYAREIPALYACENCARAGSRCYRGIALVYLLTKIYVDSTSSSSDEDVRCSRCYHKDIPCWFIHGSTRLLCRIEAEVDKGLIAKPVTVEGQTYKSWRDLLIGLSEGWRLWYFSWDRQWLEDFLSMATTGVREDGTYHVRLRDFEARQADDIAMGKAVESEERQAESAEGRQDLGEVERGQGKGKQREDMDVVVDNAPRQSKRIREESEPPSSKRYKAVDTRAVSHNFNRLSLSDRAGAPFPQDAADTANSSSRQLALSDANKHAIEHYRGVLMAGLGSRFEEERGPAFRTWLDKTMDGYERLITTDWEGVENVNEVMMQGWTAFFMQALLSQPRST
ncbi:hypothetical protein FFLO_02638 [Filobasidium floriforme]|uniref:Uncharacterized protein n=1 Tax=Filobasidium floriforme TaxID=5210 RepID=A0A8K0JML8_9TREE|nr:uncharacterized protein HD553DRAFT_91325 [Filobasidium floriforme]KAG7561909.1 hypothetical protein FFLO_02638 [Filobasidium floriforme]KAH8089390.1 hypothetical protein HD553DRAFT_91325 [Filobasidium floriforme]